MKDFLQGGAILVSIIIGLNLWVHFTSPNNTKTTTLNSTQSASSAQAIKQTKPGYFASRSESDLQQAIKLLAANNNAALNKLLASGRVFPLVDGINVYIIETKPILGRVKIRATGEFDDFWTVIEAVF